MNEPDSKFVEQLKRASSVAWQGVEYRLDLLSVEFREDKHRLIMMTVLAQVIILALFLAIMCLSVLLLLIFWEHRIAVAVTLLAGYLVIALAAAAWIRFKLTSSSHPFAATLEELKKDRAALRGDDA